MPEVTASDRQKAFLDKARKLYSDGKFKAALAAFKEASFQTCTEARANDLLTHSLKALLRCPCTRDVMVQSKKLGLNLKEIQISRCHCKDFESLSTSNSPKLAMYTLAKRACTCGSDVFHCNVPCHLNALDGVIATYEKLEAPVKARQYATLLIITSPRAPEGYLRLAKALRLGDTEQSPETITRCRWIYRQATQSVQTHGDKDHPKLKIMADLLRMDVIALVPAELRTMILENLDQSDLCRSMRVSKAWKTACLDPRLWRHLTFIGTSRRNLRKGVFNKIITKRAQCKAKSLALCGVSKLNIDLPILKATLKALNQLESLSLKGIMVAEDKSMDWQAAPPSDTWSRTLFEEAPPSLKILHMGGFVPVCEPEPRSAISAIPMAQSLEELCLSHVTSYSTGPFLLSSTTWPKLRKLTMLGFSSKEPARIDLEYPDNALNYQNPPNSQAVFNNHVLPPVTELERLVHLYMRDSSPLFARTVHGRGSLAWFMDLIKPSMSNGSLTSLAVTFCPEFQFELDRVLNKAAIHTLSCFDFLDEGPGSQCGDSFVHWIQGFHNLTTVGVFPQRSEGCWMHVSKVLARESRIETIYTDVLTGQPRDWVLAKAQEKGVKIIEASRIPEPVLQPRDGFS
ncbi:hypothetical protein LA080_012189 [Diaporthe eres]|nr:hypothetical protein LA080_012189 [Diaporthe eres]